MNENNSPTKEAAKKALLAAGKKVGSELGKFAWKYIKKLLIWASPVLIGGALLILIPVCILASVSALAGNEGDEEVIDRPSVSEDAMRYESLAQWYADSAGIPEFTRIILAIVEYQSGGVGMDIMGTGASSPDQSLEIGTARLADCLNAANCTSPDISDSLAFALAGYLDFGYLSWADSYSADQLTEYSILNALTLDTGFVSSVLSIIGSPFSGDFIHPLPGHNAISCNYGDLDPSGQPHNGTDFPAPQGVPIIASAGGTVVTAEYHNSYGNHVVIEHPGGIRTNYAHCSTLLVSEGEMVFQGQEIALVGSTGFSTGAHLHFEIFIDGKRTDPTLYLKSSNKKENP